MLYRQWLLRVKNDRQLPIGCRFINFRWINSFTLAMERVRLEISLQGAFALSLCIRHSRLFLWLYFPWFGQKVGQEVVLFQIWFNRLHLECTCCFSLCNFVTVLLPPFPPRSLRLYEKIVIVCSAFVDMIPLSFILGFYVSFTASRWWHQYTAIPWPDK